MIEEFVSKVGSKGELFPPVKLRRELGIEPGDQIIFFVQNGKLIVEPVPDLIELLESKEGLEEITLEELKRERSRLSTSLEG